MNKVKKFFRFAKFLWNDRESLYERFEAQDRTDLVAATAAYISREERYKERTWSPQMDTSVYMNSTRKVKPNPTSTSYTREIRHTSDDSSLTLPLSAAVVASVIAAADAEASSSSSSSDSFSAGGGDFSGGGADSSF